MSLSEASSTVKWVSGSTLWDYPWDTPRTLPRDNNLQGLHQQYHVQRARGWPPFLVTLGNNHAHPASQETVDHNWVRMVWLVSCAYPWTPGALGVFGEYLQGVGWKNWVGVWGGGEDNWYTSQCSISVESFFWRLQGHVGQDPLSLPANPL